MPRFLRSISVKSRMAFACTGLFVLVVAAVTWLQAVQLRSSIREVVTAQQSSLVNSVAEDMDGKFELRQKALEASAQVFTQGGAVNPSTVQGALAGLPALASLFDLLVVLTPQGDVLATLPYSRALGATSAGDRDYLKETVRTGRPVISAPYLGKLNKAPNVMMTAPILGPHGEVLAVLGGTLNLQKANFLGKVGATPLGRRGYFTVFTKGPDPLLVVHPQPSRVMTPPAQGNPSIARALAGFEGSEEGVNGRGERGFYSFRHLPRPGWVLGAMLPLEEAYAPIVEAQRDAIGRGIVAALLVAPLVWLLAWWLLSPLTALRDRIAALRADPASREELPAAEGDEIGDLARDFNGLIRERRLVEHALRQTETRLLTFADNLPVLVSYVDKDERFRYTNATYKDWFGIETGALVGRTLREVFGEREYAKIAENIALVLQGYPVTYEREAVYGSTPRFVEATYLPHYGRRGDVTGFYVLVSDISARKAKELELAHQARHDPLTGLPNRSLFEDRLGQALGRRARTGQPVALMYLDIDHFKAINDTYGHAAGDDLLRAFGQTLAGCVRSTDTVARLGGDEFTLLLESVQTAEDACGVADKILGALRAPMRLGDAIVTVSTSIGIAWADHAPVSARELVERADAALYRAKAHGKCTWEFAPEPPARLASVA